MMPPSSIHFRKFDVRPLFEKRIEPFPEIRRRIDRLTPNEGLELTAPFLPSPLIEMLKSEGFQAALHHQGDGSWIVQFWRDSA